MLTDKGRLLLNFFCQIVEAVIEISATIVASSPRIGMFEPISKPKTNTAPVNPSKTPVHCLFVTFSPNIGPLSALVKIGCRVTINAAALIVTLQPILTNALSGPILGEKVTNKQWTGVLLGFTGAVLVLGLDIGSNIPILGLLATIVALISITASTIWQKKLSNNLPLSVSNFYQA